MSSKNIILFAFCILNLISSALSGCQLRFPEDASLRPNVLLSIGSHKIDLITKKSDIFVPIFENQQIDIQCNTNLKYPDRYDTLNKISIFCKDDIFRIINYDYYGSNELFVQCSSQNWNLYETSENFAWCPSNTTSYLMARTKDLVINKFEYLAGVCYDTLNLSFKSLYFRITPQQSELQHPAVLSRLYKPTLEIKYLKETFVTKSITEADYQNQDFQDWIKYCQYNYSSVIQNSLLLNEFNHELGSLLDLIWWPNLRLGNWKRYETALTKHVESQQQSYDILSGISSVATVPIMETCETNYTLKELIDDGKRKIPMYVWNYIRATSNSSDEIVIIGFNSPFYEFYAESDVVFCSDKCQEIPWLKKVSSTFRYSALGVMFCCSIEEVNSSKRLDGFPKMDMNSIQPKMPETTTVNYDGSYEREYE